MPIFFFFEEEHVTTFARGKNTVKYPCHKPFNYVLIPVFISTFCQGPWSYYLFPRFRASANCTDTSPMEKSHTHVSERFFFTCLGFHMRNFFFNEVWDNFKV